MLIFDSLHIKQNKTVTVDVNGQISGSGSNGVLFNNILIPQLTTQNGSYSGKFTGKCNAGGTYQGQITESATGTFAGSINSTGILSCICTNSTFDGHVDNASGTFGDISLTQPVDFSSGTIEQPIWEETQSAIEIGSGPQIPSPSQWQELVERSALIINKYTDKKLDMYIYLPYYNNSFQDPWWRINLSSTCLAWLQARSWYIGEQTVTSNMHRLDLALPKLVVGIGDDYNIYNSWIISSPPVFHILLGGNEVLYSDSALIHISAIRLF